MKKRFAPALFIFLIAALCSANTPQAQASSEIPKKIQRNWAQPDCGGGNDEAVILSRYFYLKSSREEITLLPVALDREQKDYWILDLAGENVPARVEEDGILKIGAYAKGSPKKPKNWEDLKLDAADEYTGCSEAPKMVPKVLQRFMRYIDRIKEQCTVSVTNECAGVLFKLSDENNDKNLSAAEIRRTVASAVLFADLAEKKTLASKEALRIVADAAPAGQAISAGLLKSYDKNKSKSLDYDELMADFQAPDLPIVKETLEKAGTLLPSFKMAAMALK